MGFLSRHAAQRSDNPERHCQNKMPAIRVQEREQIATLPCLISQSRCNLFGDMQMHKWRWHMSISRIGSRIQKGQIERRGNLVELATMLNWADRSGRRSSAGLVIFCGSIDGRIWQEHSLNEMAGGNGLLVAYDKHNMAGGHRAPIHARNIAFHAHLAHSQISPLAETVRHSHEPIDTASTTGFRGPNHLE